MSYKFHIYRFDIESSVMEVPEDIVFNKDGTVVDAPCSSVKTMHTIKLDNMISRNTFSMTSTNEELKGLADFIYEYLENK